MLKKSQTTTFLQIFYELLLYWQVILKSMRVADDTFHGISECEWVNYGGIPNVEYLEDDTNVDIPSLLRYAFRC